MGLEWSAWGRVQHFIYLVLLQDYDWRKYATSVEAEEHSDTSLGTRLAQAAGGDTLEVLPVVVQSYQSNSNELGSTLSESTVSRGHVTLCLWSCDLVFVVM